MTIHFLLLSSESEFLGMVWGGSVFFNIFFFAFLEQFGMWGGSNLMKAFIAAVTKKIVTTAALA